MSNPDGHMIVDGDPNFNMQDVDESQLEEISKPSIDMSAAIPVCEKPTYVYM